jgi:diguanylate cyclase (GGDEF)-like protein
MKRTVADTENSIGIDTDFRRPALIVLLIFSIAFLAWHTVAEYLLGIKVLAAIELVLGLYFATLFHFARRLPYSKRLALAYLLPLLSLILMAMAHRDTPPNVFIWVFLMPVLSYSLLGRKLGFVVSTLGTVLALSAYLFHYANAPELNPLIITNAVICMSSIWVAMHLYERNREKTTNELRRMATTDELTGLHNRRQLEKVFTHLTSAADRHHQLLAVLVMDLDHFKQINDRWGHHGGDRVLVHVATLFRQHLRGSDWAFRTGGEEFCLFLPMADRAGALTVAETLRRQIAETPCDFEGHAIPLSASIGVVLYPENGNGFERLLSLADERMYRAKQQGRNRVIADDIEENTLPASPSPANLETSCT